MLIDVSGQIAFNGFNLNDANHTADGPISGCNIDRIMETSVQGVGYTEKRARSDGSDASDVYLGPRRFSLHGTLYGLTRADTFERFHALTAAFSPTLCYRADPEHKGYLPLTWQQPVSDVDNSPINLALRCRPMDQPIAGSLGWRYHVWEDANKMGQVDYAINDDGGDGLSLAWVVNMEAIDPRFYTWTYYYYLSRSIDLSAQGTGDGYPIDFANIGNYYAPIKITLVSDASSPQQFVFTGLGADIRITIPDIAVQTTVVYDGWTRLVTLAYGGNTILRPDLIAYTAERTYPEVPPGGASATWQPTNAAFAAGSQITWADTYI